jgi:hypothetical protein
MVMWDSKVLNDMLGTKFVLGDKGAKKDAKGW